MISENTYLEMKKYIAEYENKQFNSNDNLNYVEKPYLLQITVDIDKKYNPKYGNHKICKCGHEYYRHFDTYDNMDSCGCKYCKCSEFQEV